MSKEPPRPGSDGDTTEGLPRRSRSATSASPLQTAPPLQGRSPPPSRVGVVPRGPQGGVSTRPAAASPSAAAARLGPRPSLSPPGDTRKRPQLGAAPPPLGDVSPDAGRALGEFTGRFPMRFDPTGKSAAVKFVPPQPRSIAEAGLTQTMVEELVLKALFFAGELRGAELSNRIKLPQAIIDEVIDTLRRQKYVDMKGGTNLGVGRSSMTFTLTSFATDLLRQILDRNRYDGPAPVRMEEWFEAVTAQTVRGLRVNREKLASRLRRLVVKDEVLDSLGPAINSGRAIFFYGPPGNGKSAICHALVDCYVGDIYIPHALLVDDFIIRLFDATVHQRVDEGTDETAVDARWVRCRRPLVVVGGELTLRTLDLIYSPEVRFYEAPFQLKASNGMLLIDDFGRQLISPKDLLNRWIVPLESEFDFLTLHTGKKIKVPFDVFVAFATNLDPAALVDDAFLRRVRYKVPVHPPDDEQYHRIWEGVCHKVGLFYDEAVIDWLIATHYRPFQRPYAACHPRDLMAQVIDNAHYLGQQPTLSQELLNLAAKNYFVHFDDGDRPKKMASVAESPGGAPMTAENRLDDSLGNGP